MTIKTLEQLINDSNRLNKDKIGKDSTYFSRHAKLRQPKYMWIGCSDYRVPPEQLLGLDLGEIFVHRSIGNLVDKNDISLMGFIYLGLKVLNIKKVLICGHSDCALVALSANSQGEGMPSFVTKVRSCVDRVKNIYQEKFNSFSNKEDQIQFLVEKNVMEQVENFKKLDFLQDILPALEVVGVTFDIPQGELRKIE